MQAAPRDALNVFQEIAQLLESLAMADCTRVVPAALVLRWTVDAPAPERPRVVSGALEIGGILDGQFGSLLSDQEFVGSARMKSITAVTSETFKAQIGELTRQLVGEKVGREGELSPKRHLPAADWPLAKADAPQHLPRKRTWSLLVTAEPRYELLTTSSLVQRRRSATRATLSPAS